MVKKPLSKKQKRPFALLLKMGDKRYLISELMWELPLDQLIEITDRQKIIEFELKPATVKEGIVKIEGQ